MRIIRRHSEDLAFRVVPKGVYLATACGCTYSRHRVHVVSREQRPSFVTLADFRRRLNANIKDIFKEVVGLAIDVGLVQGEEIYIDHTKMEANANRHRVVWRKNAERYLGKAQAELDQLLDGRNSMGKRDPESTAMMMKDHVTIRPGYNLGIAAENGFIVGYDMSNNSNDGVSFTAVLEDAKSTVGKSPKRVCSDAGYGTLENYKLLQEEHIDCYVKYPGWNRDLKGARRPFEAESFSYDAEHDQWICPQGNQLRFLNTRQRTNPRTGYVDTYRLYRAAEKVCAACPVKDDCTRGKARDLQFGPEIRWHRKNALENLASLMGERMRSLRGVEVETPFGVSKHAYRFRRYHLRGTPGPKSRADCFFQRSTFGGFMRYSCDT